MGHLMSLHTHCNDYAKKLRTRMKPYIPHMTETHHECSVFQHFASLDVRHLLDQ